MILRGFEGGLGFVGDLSGSPGFFSGFVVGLSCFAGGFVGILSCFAEVVWECLLVL
jgi:hypothetical protein